MTQTFSELAGKLLAEHHEQYVAFTRLILSLATGSFSLLVVFGGGVIAGDVPSLTRIAYPLLLVSILAGIVVQHRVMMTPLWQANRAKRLNEAATTPEPIELRRSPTLMERVFYRVQVLTFAGAFVALAWLMYARTM